MNINRPLMPRFLKNAEQKLLLNKPGIWSTRTHLVLYYGVLFMLFLAALCFLEPTDVRDYSVEEIWVGFVSIISAIGFIVWLIYLLRFNVFKRYGNIHPLHTLGTFVLYFMATGILVLFPYVPPVVESVRANLAYGDDEIVKDMNAMNIKICQLEYHLLQPDWNYDTIALVKNLKPANEEEDDQDAVVAVREKSDYDYEQLDSTDFNNRLNSVDSTVKINDTVYLVFDTPPFNFVGSYNADKYTKEKILSAFELFNKVYNHQPTPAERERISKEFGVLLQKYQYPEDQRYRRAMEPEKEDSPFDIVSKKYWLGSIENSFSNIVEKKYRFTRPHLPDYFRIFFYCTLGISLLVLIFRHSTIRTFFLSVLAGALLVILTALILSFSDHEEMAFFIWIIAYTILFFAGSLLTWSGKKRKAVTGIMINLFVFIVPVFPLLFVGCYYVWKRNQINAQGFPEVIPNIDQYMLYAEFGGILLFLILLATYIGKVYRRWYSLPEA